MANWRGFLRGFGGVLNVFGTPLPPIPKRPRRTPADDAKNLRRDGERATALVLETLSDPQRNQSDDE